MVKEILTILFQFTAHTSLNMGFGFLYSIHQSVLRELMVTSATENPWPPTNLLSPSFLGSFFFFGSINFG